MNKCIVIGRCGKDPEARKTSSGVDVCEFSLAVDESYKNREGEKVQKTEWIKVIAWKKLAEICAKYLCKGKLVLIEGKMETQQWEDKDGAKHSTTKVVAQSMQMLDGKKKEDAPDVSAEEDAPF
jgi:single-strand DNA-binding protein